MFSEIKYSLTLTFVEYYVSVYPYASDEPGDLSFDQGETVLVTKKDGEWWTGVIGSRTGIFPFNYVQPPDIQVSSYDEAPKVKFYLLVYLFLTGSFYQQLKSK